MTHTFEVSFAESGIDRWRQVNIFRDKEGMIAPLIHASEVAVSRIIVVQKRGFTAFRARRIFSLAFTR